MMAPRSSSRSARSHIRPSLADQSVDIVLPPVSICLPRKIQIRADRVEWAVGRSPQLLAGRRASDNFRVCFKRQNPGDAKPAMALARASPSSWRHSIELNSPVFRVGSVNRPARSRTPTAEFSERINLQKHKHSTVHSTHRLTLCCRYTTQARKM